MTGHFARPLALLLALLAVLLPAAQDDNRVGLVVDFGDGQVATRCVTFAEPQIGGYDVLLRSGLALEVDQQGGGTAICRIEGTGCAADDCFCACTGDACRYWSYWHQSDGQWQYAPAGATLTEVGDGDVEGWVWGPGSVTEAPPPPAVSFADICPAGAAAVAQTAPPAAPAATGPNLAAYGGFAVLLLALGALGWLVRRRAGREADR